MVVQTDGQLVGDGPLTLAFSVVDLELNRLLHTQGPHALEAAALLGVTGGLHVGGQAVRYKTEGVKQGALA